MSNVLQRIPSIGLRLYMPISYVVLLGQNDEHRHIVDTAVAIVANCPGRGNCQSQARRATSMLCCMLLRGVNLLLMLMPDTQLLAAQYSYITDCAVIGLLHTLSTGSSLLQLTCA